MIGQTKESWGHLIYTGLVPQQAIMGREKKPSQMHKVQEKLCAFKKETCTQSNIAATAADHLLKILVTWMTVFNTLGHMQTGQESQET